MPTRKGPFQVTMEEAGRDYYCACCAAGFATPEEFQEHYDGDEHVYHKTRKVQQLLPGEAFCTACNLHVRSAENWSKHIIGDRHEKVVKSIEAILGKTGLDYNVPLNCVTPGELGEPIMNLSEIDCEKSKSIGYDSNAIPKGVALLGLQHVSPDGTGEGQLTRYNCSFCKTAFNFQIRLSHLNSPTHRYNYIASKYPDYVVEIARYDKERKFRRSHVTMYYAHLVEEAEIEQEDDATMKVREDFIDGTPPVISKQERARLMKTQPKYGPAVPKRTPTRPPLVHRAPRPQWVHRGPRPNMMNRGPPQFIQRGPRGTGPMRGGPGPMRGNSARGYVPFNGPHHGSNFPQPGGPYPNMQYAGPSQYYSSGILGASPNHGGRGAILGKRPTDNRRHEQSNKRTMGAPDRSEAMDAISVLENYALKKAQDEVKKKIENMKRAVNADVDLTDIPEFAELAGKVEGPQSYGQPPQSFNMGHSSQQQPSMRGGYYSVPMNHSGGGYNSVRGGRQGSNNGFGRRY